MAGSTQRRPARARRNGAASLKSRPELSSGRLAIRGAQPGRDEGHPVTTRGEPGEATPPTRAAALPLPPPPPSRASSPHTTALEGGRVRALPAGGGGHLEPGPAARPPAAGGLHAPQGRVGQSRAGPGLSHSLPRPRSARTRPPIHPSPGQARPLRGAPAGRPFRSRLTSAPGDLPRGRKREETGERGSGTSGDSGSLTALAGSPPAYPTPAARRLISSLRRSPPLVVTHSRCYAPRRRWPRHGGSRRTCSIPRLLPPRLPGAQRRLAPPRAGRGEAARGLAARGDRPRRERGAEGRRSRTVCHVSGHRERGGDSCCPCRWSVPPYFLPLN